MAVNISLRDFANGSSLYDFAALIDRHVVLIEKILSYTAKFRHYALARFGVV